ncbi:terminase small subunit [Levilactobacillus tujiorum]|uniref:terminase small subunit n=1 Tax=Levilactobacillus tujiorum TaxID=2912243 RepID=UPI0014563CA4|nr:terminase small subunit [Levilactobacillus tujiorum]NLR31383.1 terminase small subunit [Levilactobacillus tujiorum]
MQKLTVKQFKFVEAYIASGNATQAATEAGYSKKTAYKIGTENLKKPQILKALEKRTEEIKTERIDSQQEVMEFLSDVRRGKVQETVVTPGGRKVTVPSKVSERIKAAELIGKRYAMWTDKQDLTATINPVQITDNVPAGSDDDG